MDPVPVRNTAVLNLFLISIRLGLERTEVMFCYCSIVILLWFGKQLFCRIRNLFNLLTVVKKYQRLLYPCQDFTKPMYF